ncbi:hypothetical protein RRG08_052202, partial [Elysia crispata]
MGINSKCTATSILTWKDERQWVCVCVPALTASGVTTATSILTPKDERQCKWCNNSNIHPDSGKMRKVVCVCLHATASGVHSNIHPDSGKTRQ